MCPLPSFGLLKLTGKADGDSVCHVCSKNEVLIFWLLMLMWDLRCTALIARCLRQVQMAMERPNEYDMPDKDFLIVALDLLSGLAEGLADHIDHLVASSHIVELIYQCSLVGDYFMHFDDLLFT